MPRHWVFFSFSLLLCPLAGCSTDQSGSQAAAARAQVQVALRQPASVEVVEQPLEQVLEKLAESQGLTIDIDEKTLAPLWKGEPPWVTLDVEGIPLESALRLLLRPHELAFVVHDDRIEVTTQVEADKRMTVEVYVVQDILENYRSEFREDDLAEAITDLIEAASWEEVGGGGFIQDAPGAIIVGQTPEAHARIARLLDDIRRVADPQQVWPERAPPSASEQAIRQALGAPTTLDFTNIPLAEVIEQLRRRLGINIVLDAEKLAVRSFHLAVNRLTLPLLANARPLQAPVLLHVADVPLESALNLLASQADVDWLIRDDVLLITSPEQAQDCLETVVYSTERLQDRWPIGPFVISVIPVSPVWPTDGLVELIEDAIEPATWSEVGGPCSIEAVPGGLAVTAPQRMQKELAHFLAELERAIDPFTLEPYRQELPPERRKIEARLDQTVSLDWRERPLEDALTELTREQGISNLVIDRAALGDMGVGRDVPLTLAVSNISLRSALNLALADCELEFLVQDGALLVTSKIGCEKSLEHRIYHVPYLLNDSSVLTNMVEPSSWDEVGGPGAVLPIPGGLVVAQTADIHAQVEHLLAGVAWLADPGNYPSPDAIPSPAVARLRQTLAQPVTVDLKDVTLQQAVEALARGHGVENVVFDSRVLNDSSFDRHLLVSAHLRNISLGGALDAVLSNWGLTWLIQDEVLRVTAAGRANYTLETRCYRVPLAPDEPEGVDPDALVEAIERGIDSASWEDAGGPGSIEFVAGGLVVSQSLEVHQQVKWMLHDLRPFVPGIDSLIAADDAKERARRDAALAGPAGVAAESADLQGALDDLAARHGLNILIGWGTVQDEALLPSRELVRYSPEKSVADALDELVRPLGLTWVVRDEAIVVLNQLYYDTVETWTRVYDVRAILAPAGPLDEAELAEFITWTARPFEVKGTDLPAAHTLRGALVACGSREDHGRWKRMFAANPEAIQRLAAVTHLAQDSSDAETLRAGLADESPLVHWYAWFQLARTRTLLLLDEAIVGLSNDDPHIRLIAADILGRLGPGAAKAVPELARRLSDEDRWVQYRAAEALGKMGPAAGPAVAALASAFEDANHSLRERIDEAFGHIGAAAVPVLVERARRSESLWHARACTLLGEMGPAAADAVPVLVDLLENHGSPHRSILCRALAGIGPPAHVALPTIVKLFSETSHLSRAAACEALPAIGADAAEAVPLLLTALEASESAVRAAACSALGEYGPAASDAIGPLRAALTDPDEEVRQAAEMALDLIEGVQQ